MKKRIALFANGWSNEYLSVILSGIQKCAAEEDIDLFMFLNYAAYNETPENNAGEINIFRLPQLDTFDGAVVFGNILNSEEAVELLTEKIAASGIPAISLERELAGMDYIGASNYPGMYELVEHLVVKHRVKNAVFIGGPENNEESRERLQALRDAFNKHGRSVEDGDVYYGDYSYVTAVEITKRIVEERIGLPDVIVCANDYSAMGAIIVLDQLGIRVPEQVIVTGFDGVEKGQIFSPSITTVEREWNQMGYRTLKHLLKQIEGKPVEAKEMLHAKLARAESCGCGINRENLNRRKQFCRQGFQSDMETITFEWSVNDMEHALSDTNGVDKLYDTFEKYFLNHQEQVGEDLYIMQEDDFLRSVLNNDISLRRTGYSEQMRVVLAMEQGEIHRYKHFKSKYLVPGYNGETKGSDFFLFLPIHYRDKSFGYMVFKNHTQMVSNQRMFTWMSRVDQNLEKFRQNQKLDVLNKQLMELYTKDSLTGLLNRFGQECVAVPLFGKLRDDGKSCIILFADINHMKNINDHYGHLQGDLALRAVANVIKESVREDWIGIRYGGDEFLVIGECPDAETADSICVRMEEGLRTIGHRMELPYELSVSIGYKLSEPETGMSLVEYIKLADEEMYQHKQARHKRAEE